MPLSVFSSDFDEEFYSQIFSVRKQVDVLTNKMKLMEQTIAQREDELLATTNGFINCKKSIRCALELPIYGRNYKQEC